MHSTRVRDINQAYKILRPLEPVIQSMILPYI